MRGDEPKAEHVIFLENWKPPDLLENGIASRVKSIYLYTMNPNGSTTSHLKYILSPTLLTLPSNHLFI